MILPGYDLDKAAQATAFFALKAGGSINVLKLSKLLYIAERSFIAEHDSPMFFDRLYSMPDGPVVSITLNFINGSIEDPRWSEFVAPRKEYEITVASNKSFDDLRDLSRADTSVLNSVWERFKSYDKYQLRDWTHDPKNIPEWVDPQGSSKEIPPKTLLSILGKRNVDGILNDIKAHRHIRKEIEQV